MQKFALFNRIYKKNWPSLGLKLRNRILRQCQPLGLGNRERDSLRRRARARNVSFAVLRGSHGVVALTVDGYYFSILTIDGQILKLLTVDGYLEEN